MVLNNKHLFAHGGFKLHIKISVNTTWKKRTHVKASKKLLIILILIRKVW